MKTQWHIVYFRPGTEKKLSEVLTKKKIENYFPVSKLIEDWSSEKKPLEKALFDSYLFIKASDKQLAVIKNTPYIISLVYWLGKPVVITDAEIATLKRFLSEHVNVSAEKITLGTEVEFPVSTSFQEEENLFKVSNENINVVLPSLGYKFTAAMETSNVRIITTTEKHGTRPASTTPNRLNPAQFINNLS